MFGDQFGPVANYDVDINMMNKNLSYLADGKELNLSYYEKLFNDLDCKTGVNLIDFFILHKYIEKNNIKKVTELGYGSTSIFLDSIGIKRETFAVDRAGVNANNEVEFVKCNIYKSADMINESCKTSDLILIDSQHAYTMAEFYHNNILINHNLPIFMHDFMAPGRQTYSEQIYWINHLINKEYTLYISSDCLYHGQLFETSGIIPPVSAIFEPINQ